MSESETVKVSRPWVRPPPKVSGPDRTAGGFYRTAERKGSTLGGVPLNTAEDAVVAAVRMAYKVAEVQVDRSARLARRLRDAGDRAVGPDSERHALDAAERLVFRTMMGGLTWLEGAAAERDSPLKRILDAQYRMVGSMLGLTPSKSSSPEPTPRQEEKSERVRRGATRSEDAPRSRRSARFLNIMHGNNVRRMVRVTAADFVAVIEPRTDVVFYNARQADTEPLSATLVMRGKSDSTLEIKTRLSAPPGLWRAAICDKEGRQLGFIEIVL